LSAKEEDVGKEEILKNKNAPIGKGGAKSKHTKSR
jgi:hypothetical protein